MRTFIDSLTDDERAKIGAAWKSAGIPPIAHGLTTAEASEANALIFETLESDVVDAEIVPSAENRESEANGGDLEGYSDAPFDETPDPRGTPRDGEEPFAYDEAPKATPTTEMKAGKNNSV